MLHQTTKSTIAANRHLRVGSSASKAAAGLSQRNGNETGPQFDRVRFVQRVEQAFAAIGDRGGSLRLKLSPPELGSMRIEITVRKGVMKARIEAETSRGKKSSPGKFARLTRPARTARHKNPTIRRELKRSILGRHVAADRTASRIRELATAVIAIPGHTLRKKAGSNSPLQEIRVLTNHNGQLNVIV